LGLLLDKEEEETAKGGLEALFFSLLLIFDLISLISVGREESGFSPSSWASSPYSGVSLCYKRKQSSESGRAGRRARNLAGRKFFF